MEKNCDGAVLDCVTLFECAERMKWLGLLKIRCPL